MLSLSPVTTAERNWAALAHLSALVTVGLGWATGGIGAVVALLVPLGLYVFFRERAPYVAYHSLQATVFQAGSAVLYVLTAVVLAGAVVFSWAAAALLSVVVIGLALLPVAVAVTVLAIVFLVVAPLAGLAYVLRGAYLAVRGEGFEYPLFGGLVARSLGFASMNWLT